jgi:hypothetical protein
MVVAIASSFLVGRKACGCPFINGASPLEVPGR